MPIPMPPIGTSPGLRPAQDLTPRAIVEELDRYIVGQRAAKRAVAVALRNRWRRRRTPEALRDEITPKNILMIGPTGVGKTEIARRLAKLAQAPFLKVEATKFTEVGYVGRDVDQIVRDLVESAIAMVREKRRGAVKARAEAAAEERILDALTGPGSTAARESFRKKLRAGELNDREVELQLQDNASPLQTLDIPGQPQMGMLNIGDIFGKAFGGRTKTHKTTVAGAYAPLLAEESDKLLDQEALTQEALELAENHGIVFLDEIDKVATRQDRVGADVSREGVQRDLLPLIEGTTVATKHGPVKTDHILFIASGAFHVAKPSDLLPELQGRLPIRVELKALTRDDMRRILVEPEANLIRQHQALLATEGVTLTFTPEAIDALADAAVSVNGSVENIGARRLQTVLEKVLEEVSFNASDRSGETVNVDAAYVNARIGDLAQNTDLSRFIL
jgi:ATP-dependent HslUV protease ATP-binding subunit HslU